MKKVDATHEDEMRSQYPLKQLRVRRIGPEREAFGQVVRLAPDVARIFSDAASVNEALRFLIRVTQDGDIAIPDRSSLT